jgi:hypothetical protein
MLDRSPSPAAVRARERRARQRAGIVRDLRIRIPTRRLVAAMRAANPRLPEGELTTAEVEAELEAIVLAFVERYTKAADQARLARNAFAHGDREGRGLRRSGPDRHAAERQGETEPARADHRRAEQRDHGVNQDVARRLGLHRPARGSGEIRMGMAQVHRLQSARPKASRGNRHRMEM